MQIIVNAFSLSFYAVMTFLPHQECETPDESNATPILKATFIIGFVVHSINFFVVTYVEPTFRAQIHKLTENDEWNTKVASLFWNVFWSDYAFKGLIILFSFYQLVIVNTPDVKFCAMTSGALRTPATWTYNLALL